MLIYGYVLVGQFGWHNSCVSTYLNLTHFKRKYCRRPPICAYIWQGSFTSHQQGIPHMPHYILWPHIIILYGAGIREVHMFKFFSWHAERHIISFIYTISILYLGQIYNGVCREVLKVFVKLKRLLLRCNWMPSRTFLAKSFGMRVEDVQLSHICIGGLGSCTIANILSLSQCLYGVFQTQKSRKFTSIV